MSRREPEPIRYPDFPLETHRRNARFRAWQGLGLPIRARWKPSRGRGLIIRELLAGEILLIVVCLACDKALRSLVTSEDTIQLKGFPPMETEHFGALLRLARQIGCPHLARILDEDPPELAALTALELLGGEGGGGG